MSDSKAQAAYGAAPPPQALYHRPGHHGHRSCGLCCIFTTLLKLVFAIVVILGIAALVLWLVLWPATVKFYVEDASLTQFNLTGNKNLFYNLHLNVSIRNPNKKIGVYYDRLDADAYYGFLRFGYVSLPAFYQGHQNTTVVRPVFAGQSVIVPGDFVFNSYNEEKAKGSFDINVRMRPEMKFKIGHLKTTKYSPKVWCYLTVPVLSKNSSFPCYPRTRPRPRLQEQRVTSNISKRWTRILM